MISSCSLCSLESNDITYTVHVVADSYNLKMFLLNTIIIIIVTNMYKTLCNEVQFKVSILVILVRIFQYLTLKSDQEMSQSFLRL